MKINLQVYSILAIDHRFLFVQLQILALYFLKFVFVRYFLVDILDILVNTGTMRKLLYIFLIEISG
jgi:hypothetical protein